MVDKKEDYETPQEESDVDRINKFVTDSEDENSDEDSKTESAEKTTENVDEEESEEYNTDAKNDDETKEDEKIEEESKKKPAISRPKHHTTKHAPKPALQKEEKKEVKKTERKMHPDIKESHKESKSIHQKKVETKKESAKNDDKKSREVTTMKKAKQPKNNENGKENRKKSRFTKNTLMWIGIAVLAAILVIAIVLLVSPKNKDTTDGNQTIKNVAATVNGEAIYLQDIQDEYDALNPILQKMYTIESMLNKSIDDILLKQEAKDSGVKVSDGEVQTTIDLVKKQNQLTDEQFEQAIEMQGMTMDEVKELLRNNLMIQKFLNDTILQNITITENNIEAYYTLNVEKYVSPEQVTVQHILVMVTPNLTESQAKEKIEQIEKEFNGSNFCELVTEYSDDSGSLNTCGKYTFGRGDFNNPEFENPSFDLKIGEHSITQTTFGYHLINKLESIPSRTLDLAEVHDEINATLHDETAQKRFDTLMEGLRSEATIINYLTKEGSNESLLIPLNTPANLDDFAKCLTENNATLYGASWCPHCNNQKEAFGDSIKYVTYVECADEDNPQVQTDACDKAGISGYPTWIIGGKQYPGEQSLSRLAQLSKCELP
ncbi:MAG: SurA N-terminal domain-containing protein [Candidatus Woesearchaeota archaeon]